MTNYTLWSLYVLLVCVWGFSLGTLVFPLNVSNVQIGHINLLLCLRVNDVCLRWSSNLSMVNSLIWLL